MRLDDFDPNIEASAQRGGSGGFGGGGGGMGGLLVGLLPMIGSRFGCGGIVVALLLLAVFGGLGNLGSLVSGVTGGGTAPVAQQPGGETKSNAVSVCTSDPARRATCNAFTSAQKTWEGIFAQRGQTLDPPQLVFFDGSGQSGCGAASAATGPFYCPPDQGVYLDTDFFDELATRFGAQGDFAQYYVVAHEFGHHIQSLTGASERVQQIQRGGSRAEGNAASVRLELQADCYAGLWAGKNRDRLEPGDLEEGLTAASAIGDDKLTQGRASPESFTHGTSEQRMRWLRRGLETADPAQCDTFSGAI
jgi:hypothetical protein